MTFQWSVTVGCLKGAGLLMGWAVDGSRLSKVRLAILSLCHYTQIHASSNNN